MSNKVKKAVITSTIIILVIVAIIATFFIVRHFINKSKIDTVTEIYSDDDVQERLDNNETDATSNLLLQIDGETVLGVIKIDKIGFEGLIYEGHKILPYCPRCGTGLASHEVAQGYQEDKTNTEDKKNTTNTNTQQGLWGNTGKK